ncbi:MAG: Undecaprenyl-diphosphatase BcrC [Verrucomicrobia bacterium ADurb.Bin474]|nr:MAG: Undecaprenyl-diphosphatase BcrC [Verrucomicrobia bacterium ADurb.Bin474]
MCDSLKYTGRLLKESWTVTKRFKWLIIGSSLVFFLIAFWTMQFDKGWLGVIRQDPSTNPDVHHFAGKVSYYGMYVFTPLGLCAAIWIAGWRLNREHLKRAAIACFVAGTVAGIIVNVFRPGFARPRPRAELPDRFHWVEFDSDLHSFPSGHVMSNIAGATTLTIMQPAIGVPYILFSGAIGWSRMQRASHYPTDVGLGTALGVIVGLAIAGGVRRAGPMPVQENSENSTD